MYPQWILDNKENYKSLLKHFESYSKKNSIWEQNFTFSNCSIDPNLLELYEDNNLISLKKKRNDFEVCLRAMEWTFHHLMAHQFSDYSGELNAKNILKFKKESHVTVNCLCHATVLVELLLALNIKARKVSCMPIDVVPIDNHVVVEAYVHSLGKWIMLDPSMCCYITNSDDKPLSISEIRKCLIYENNINIQTYSRFSNLTFKSNKSLKLDSNEYITYLYKNFFRFVMRENQNSIATKEGDVFYMLVPKGYFYENTSQRIFIEDAMVEMRITNNDKFFWNY